MALLKIHCGYARWVLGCLILLSYSTEPAFCQSQNSSEPPVFIVLILDDMGNNLELGQRAIALPGAITYSFLPHRPYSETLANIAHQQQKEVMLHAPMSNVHSHPMGPGSLTPIMDQHQFLLTLRNDLASIPYVRGVNNHMGSLMTQLRQPMGWMMQELKQQQLYFIDSRTSPLTIAEATAHSEQLPTLRRNVFLDNERNSTAIHTQFERLITLARAQGSAVAIGHPYPETLEFLEQALPLLAAKGIILRLASQSMTQTECENLAKGCLQKIELARTSTSANADNHNQ